MLVDGRLSPHFTLAEMTFSQRAGRLGIKNEPTLDHIENLKALCENVLEPLRTYLYGAPIHISSAYRSRELNAETPGSASMSQHTRGEAADIVVRSIPDLDKLVMTIRELNLPVDQCILEFGWVHVSHKRGGPQRREFLRAIRRLGGGVAYEPLRV